MIRLAGVDGVLLDLLMAVMDSMSIWAAAAGDRERGLAWRDAVTARMASAGTYQPYEELVAAEARRLGMAARAAGRVRRAWSAMCPWPDAAALGRLPLPYAFVTNCSRELAAVAAARSGLAPRFTLSAEEAGRYKPDRRVYRAACRRLRTAPARTLFIAGSPYDAAGAHAAGLVTVLVARRTVPHDLPPDIAVIRSLENLVLGQDASDSSAVIDFERPELVTNRGDRE